MLLRTLISKAKQKTQKCRCSLMLMKLGNSFILYLKVTKVKSFCKHATHWPPVTDVALLTCWNILRFQMIVHLIFRCITTKGRTISGLTSHVCHILMQQLLLIVVRASLSGGYAIVIDICWFFVDLYSKENHHEVLQISGEEHCTILYKMKMFFSPSVFTIMLYMTVHLVSKAKLGGPTQ